MFMSEYVTTRLLAPSWIGGKLRGNQHCLLPEYFAAGILTTIETTKQIIDFKTYLHMEITQEDAVLKVYDFLTLYFQWTIFSIEKTIEKEGVANHFFHDNVGETRFFTYQNVGIF